MREWEKLCRALHKHLMTLEVIDVIVIRVCFIDVLDKKVYSHQKVMT